MSANDFAQFGPLSPREIDIVRVTMVMLTKGMAKSLREQAADQSALRMPARTGLTIVADAMEDTCNAGATFESFAANFMKGLL